MVRVSTLAGALVSLFIFPVHGLSKSCQVSFDEDKALVQGTGFKFTNKTAVTAKFVNFELNQNKPQKDAKALLAGLQVSVDLLSIDSGDALRDRNLQETLFANILGDSKVTVKVLKVTEKLIEAELALNDKKQKIDFQYSLNQDRIEATGSFDALQFALNSQVEALKKRCGSLHTGPDGKSVTWTQFDLKVTAPFKKICG